MERYDCLDNQHVFKDGKSCFTNLPEFGAKVTEVRQEKERETEMCGLPFLGL